MTTTHQLNCDVLVAGGGAAGVPCALAAARCGAKVILCHDRPVLGGNASSEIRMHIVGANGTGRFDRGKELQTEAREGGIIEEIRLENCVRNPQRSASMFDLILYDKVRSEPNLTLLLNTSVNEVQMQQGVNKIGHVIAERPSTEDRFRIDATTFIDCTGDGRLAFEAGAEFMRGREGKDAFNEPLAREQADSHQLGSTILITARRHDRPMPFVAPNWVRSFTKEDLRLRLYACPGEEEPTHEYGYWWAEWGGTLDTIKDNETIRDELLAVTLGIWNHIKNGPAGTAAGEDPFSASHWALEWIGFVPGKRESRRFIGQHVLTQQDLQTSRRFDDAIAYGGWSMDLHPPEGVDVPDEEPCVQHALPRLYDIPLRSCVARDVRNLMFAGRNISATHVAFSSTRVMATCAAIGQGVGTAAALASAESVSAADIVTDQQLVNRIQQRLLSDDSFLIGKVNDCSDDITRLATITASSEQAEGPAVNVISGQTRSVHGESGVAADRTVASSHRWMSVCDEFPAWIQFDWQTPQRIHSIQLIFDTGLHRHLTLTHHDGYNSKMQWGTPQSETVRDYSIQCTNDGNWQDLITVTDNYQRRRQHTFPGVVHTKSLRVTVTATNGIDHVRVMEVRVY
ncbi:FAD-dependent oxidoreductase [Fuerstiella marisgermanici]|uniref:Putative FAD-binding dehydrogenase n=1 Tax=Fuerstiella marisgermanici TaxID=1891926 RepID=A0A1P8WPQ4_9PLAN|nr:FAD-dependent oxidoreductase [Fuerstiella marisgermanici]APZ96015.1 putative FAD-binding dehydrogenase [Fuerstiella marisgermanici]